MRGRFLFPNRVFYLTTRHIIATKYANQLDCICLPTYFMDYIEETKLTNPLRSMTSPPITIDILIFVAFFLLNIIVGFRYRGKSQSFKEYAIGDKKFSTATLTATLVATWMSGSALFINLENIHTQGLYYGIADIIATPLGLLIIGYIVGPRMGKFLNALSVPDALGKLYGKPVQAIAGITTLLRSTFYIAMQLQVIARILAILFDYEGPEVVTIVAMIITSYALSGGVKAVTFTDILQFFTFGTLLPILALTVWNNLQDSPHGSHICFKPIRFSPSKK